MGGETYEIRIEGDLPPAVRDLLADQLQGLSVSVEPVASVLQGPGMDQAALYGLLDQLAALGLVVLEVRRVPVTSTPGEVTP
ncbi:MAG: hypothetical protein ACRDYU_09200 [Actinomycetes bacterium]